MTSRSQQVKKSIKIRQTRRLLAESLENRQLMAVDLVSFSNGTLSLWANDTATHAEISQIGSTVRISERGSVRDVSAPGLTQVRFYGGNGDDFFKTNISSVQLIAYGRGGDDEFHGSKIRDMFYGEGGNDRLFGREGDDWMSGGEGDDALNGQDGNDSLYGGDDNDVLKGGYGLDRIFGGEGNDHIDGQYDADYLHGEAGNDVIVSIDAAFGDTIRGGGGVDTFWTDSVSGSRRDEVLEMELEDRLHRVNGFANGADRTLNGDRIADPGFHYDRLWLTDPYENRQFRNIELFDSNGPTADDVQQGGVGDCVLLSTLASIADRVPNEIRERIVDFRDGTYGVLVGGKYFRVDNDLPVWKDYETLVYAQMGDVQSMWVAIFEKAYAIYKGNSYGSIDGLNAESVFKDLHLNSIGWHWANSFNTAASLANRIDTLLRSGNQVLIGSLDRFPGDTATVRESSPLVRNHAYTVMRVVKNSSGVITGIVVRNPWGSDGGTATGDTSDGLVTLTPAQLLRYTETITYGKV